MWTPQAQTLHATLKARATISDPDRRLYDTFNRYFYSPDDGMATRHATGAVRDVLRGNKWPAGVQAQMKAWLSTQSNEDEGGI